MKGPASLCSSPLYKEFGELAYLPSTICQFIQGKAPSHGCPFAALHIIQRIGFLVANIGQYLLAQPQLIVQTDGLWNKKMKLGCAGLIISHPPTHQGCGHAKVTQTTSALLTKA